MGDKVKRMVRGEVRADGAEAAVGAKHVWVKVFCRRDINDVNDFEQTFKASSRTLRPLSGSLKTRP